MKILFIILAISFTSSAIAEQEWILGLGKGMDDTLIQSKSISDAEQWEISWSWNLKKIDSKKYGYYEWWLQAGYMEFHGEHQGVKDELSLYQLKPIIRIYPDGADGSLFFEAGLGASRLSKKTFEQITIKTQGNFVIHAAAGWKFSENSKLSLRYSHFSNGYTHTPNPGIDSLSFNYHLSF